MPSPQGGVKVPTGGIPARPCRAGEPASARSVVERGQQTR